MNIKMLNIVIIVGCIFVADVFGGWFSDGTLNIPNAQYSRVIVIDSCEYIQTFANGQTVNSSYTLINKSNCKFCIDRNKHK